MEAIPEENCAQHRQGITTMLSGGLHIISMHTTLLRFPYITDKSRIYHVLPTLKSGALLSIGDLCGDRCTSIFTDQNLTINK